MNAVRHFSVLLSVFLLRHLNEAMKCLRSCEDGSRSFPECGACLQDCPFTFQDFKAQRYLRDYSKKLQLEYDPFNNEVTWFFKDSWTDAEKSDVTVTMHDWNRREAKGQPIQQCCGVSISQGKCKVSLTPGNLLFWSLNENGTSYGAANAIYRSQPVATSIYFCGDEERKEGEDLACLAIEKRQGRMTIIKHVRLEATSVLDERNLVPPQMCLSHHLNGDVVRAPKISKYFRKPIVEIAPAKTDTTHRECQPTSLREISSGDFPDPEAGGPRCFYFGHAVERAYLYCVSPEKVSVKTIPLVSNKEDAGHMTFVYVAIAAAFLVLIVVVILAFVLRARRRANAATKDKHSDWRSQEGILVADSHDEKFKHDEAPSVV